MKRILILILALVTITLFVFGVIKLTQDTSQDPPNASQDSQNTSQDSLDTSQFSLETIPKVPDFSTVDQYGNPIDQTVFAKAEHTLLVFWATWCSPCIAEIPVLVAAEDALRDMDVQIVGICEDGKIARDLALQILQTQGASYANIMPNDQFYDEFVSLCFTFPSAMLIGSDGSVEQHQFMLETNADAIVSQTQAMLRTPANPSDAPADPRENPDPISTYYEKYRQDMLEAGHMESTPRISNLPTFVEMHKKAYAYTTDQYFLQINIEINGKKSGEIRRFVTDGNYREEEYSNGTISYVTVYNAQRDEYSLYDVASGNGQLVRNASLKGYLSIPILYASMDILTNNAVIGTLSDTEYEGKPAVLSFDEENGYSNKVWMDKETGILLRYEQIVDGRKYTETYTFTPNVAFDASIFKFDSSVLSVDTKEQ